MQHVQIISNLFVVTVSSHQIHEQKLPSTTTFTLHIHLMETDTGRQEEKTSNCFTTPDARMRTAFPYITTDS